MAGFGIAGIDPDGTGILNISAVMESRGKSWAIGGDEGAFTVANFMQHYSPKIQGPSKGEHIAEICQDILCLDYRMYIMILDNIKPIDSPSYCMFPFICCGVQVSPRRMCSMVH